MRTKAISLITLCYFLFTPIIFSQVFGPSFRSCILQAPQKHLDGVRKIAILNFKNNTNIILKELGPNLESKIPDYMTKELLKEYRGANEKKIFMTKVPTNIFSVVERNEIDKIMEEQGRNVSGMVDESEAVEIGKLLGVDALVVGDFSYTPKEETRTTSRKKKDGTKVTTYWREKEVRVSSTIKIVSIETGEILALHSAEAKETDSASSEKGYPQSSSLNSTGSMAEKGLKNISSKIVDYFTPKYQTINISLRKVKTKEFKAMAKDAIKFLKDGEIDRGYAIYKEIFEKDGYNPVAIYNMGAVNEAVGNFMKAKEYYDMAYQLDEDTKAYKQAAEKSESYENMLANMESLGVTITPYSFDVKTAQAKANQVEVQGSSKERISVYASPDKSSEVLARVPGGVDLQVLETTSGWFKVKLLGGKEGYLPSGDGKAK